MKASKIALSLVAASCLATALNAADTLAEALSNGKFSAGVKATYATQKDERSDDKYHSIFGVGLEAGYVTDAFYGFRVGMTGQAYGSPFTPKKPAKTMYDKEWYANGAVLSELYLGYSIGKTDIIAGRQYYVSPLVAGNYTRAYKEAFEGVSIENKDIPDTSLRAAWFYKFQGRSKVTMNDAGSSNDIDDVGRAPSFKDRVIVAGLGPYALKFDNIFTGAVQNSSVPGLKLTAAYARASGVEYYANRGDDVNLYILEANYRLGFDAFKLGFDAMYKGSRTNGQMGESHLDGNMYNLRVGIYELAGFSASYAYSINSKNNSTILGIGNGPGSYTFLPIRGPFVYTAYAGMQVHKIVLDYNFKAVGIDGLKTSLQFVKGEQDSLNNGTHKGRGIGQAKGTSMDVKGFAAVLSYDIPQVKGLGVSATYAALERDLHAANGKSVKKDNNELWLQAKYNFNFSK